MAGFQGLTLHKNGDKSCAIVGDVITYALTVTNIAPIPLSKVYVTDSLGSALEFVTGSVMIDGVSFPQENILSGINLSTMAPGAKSVILFKANILDGAQPLITNVAVTSFTYQLIGGTLQQMEVISNPFNTTIYTAALDVIKTADQEQVMLGDTLTYTVNLVNTGSLMASNVLFTDHLPAQMQLIPGSFKIAGTVVNSVNLTQGIMVGSIAAGKTLTLTYQVKILGTNCSNVLTNSAQAQFQYRLPDGKVGSVVAKDAQSTVDTEVAITTFKQMSIESYLMIPEVKPDIEAINSVTGVIDIAACHVITTPIAHSTEGQIITGYKLVIRGNLNLVIEYTALDTEQSVHSAHYSVAFSTFIVLPPNYGLGSRLDVTGTVEDIYYKAIDIRNFFTNTTALINVNIINC